VTRVAREVGSEEFSAAKPKCAAFLAVEGFDRLGEFHGRQPDGAGAKHRARHNGVRNGDLSKKITVDVKGEIAELKKHRQHQVDQLSSFASEVTRVAREVGSEGILAARRK